MFTSRLPMSTSVRRPTNASDGSTSFGSHYRPSNIPVTARKANLFTPQTKRPLFNGSSTARKSYVSGFTTDSKANKRGPKPAPDRDEQLKMFDNLVEFMRINAPNLPVPDPKKFFSSVSTTESARIFEFLISAILPEFKINRLETDVPEALNQLGYPHIRHVTKSALVSVTSRQAAANLLVIFDWLIVQVRTETSKDCDFTMEDPDAIEQSGLAYDVLFYPDDEEADAELFNRIFPLENDQMINNQLQDVVTEKERLSAEVEEVREYMNTLEEMRRDLAKLETFKTETSLYFDYRTKQVNSLRKTSEDIRSERLTLNEKINDISLKRRDHSVPVEEANHILSAVSPLVSKLEALKQNNLKLSERVKQLEIGLQSRSEELKSKVNDFCKECRNLRDLYLNLGFSTNTTSKRLDFLFKASSGSLTAAESQSLFQNLEETKNELINETREVLQEMKKELDELELSDRKFDESTPQIKSALEKENSERYKIERDFQEDMSKMRHQIEEQRRFKDRLSEDPGLLSLHEESKMLEARLDEARERRANCEKLDTENLKAVIEVIKLKESNELTDIDRDCRQRKESMKIAEHNNKVAKAAYRLLKRRLNLPSMSGATSVAN